MTIIGILVVIVTLLISAALHEAMHAFTSNWLGDDTARLQGRLTLNPLKHLDLFGSILLPAFLVYLNVMGASVPIFGAAKPVPFNPYRLRFDEFGAALVALAGPLTNLLLAVVAGLTLRFTGPEGVVLELFELFVYINIGFFVFNMLPIPPLDGSRLLYALAPEPIQKMMRSIEQYGVVPIFILLFFAGNSLLVFVGNIINAIATSILG